MVDTIVSTAGTTCVTQLTHNHVSD